MNLTTPDEFVAGNFYKLLVTKCVCRKPSVGGKGGDHEFVTILNHTFQGRYLRFSGTRQPSFKFEVSSNFMFMVEPKHLISAEKMDPKLHPELRPRNRQGKLIMP